MTDINQEWFVDHALGDPKIAFWKYTEWLDGARNPDDEARLRKAIESAAELSRAAISFYRGNKLQHKLSKRTLAQLDSMVASLQSDDEFIAVPRRRLERHRGSIRVALLTEVASLPNFRFHFDVWRGLVWAAPTYHATIATHEVLSARQLEETGRILRIYAPDAVIYLRLSPTKECLRQLHAAGVGAVLVHSDEYATESAPLPILANIIPSHRYIPGELAGRVRQFFHDRKHRGVSTTPRKVVILAMKAELGSLRYRRIEALKRAFRSFDDLIIQEELVLGYGFQHALQVLLKHDDGQIYCCLSDELAVGVSHFFKARNRGKSHDNRAGRLIVGYDDSQLAREQGISSFGQNLDEIGRIAMDQISGWWDSGGQVEHISFRLIETDVHLVARGFDEVSNG